MSSFLTRSIAVVAAAALAPASVVQAREPATVAEVAARAEKHEPLSIVFFGGSLTWGANASDPNATSYRGRMMRWLRERYPQTPLAFHDAAIGGQGSTLGMFRMERDVLAHSPDLVFLDFTVNDDIGTADPLRLAAYERVMRDLLSSGAAVLPVFMCVRGTIVAPDSDPVPARYQAHQKLAASYGLVGADTLQTARAAVAGGRVRPDALYPFDRDPTHPDDVGYELFFEAARDAWLKAEKTSPASTMPEHPVFPDLFPRRARLRIADGVLPAGWSRSKTFRTSMWFDNLSSRWVGDVARADGSRAEPLVLNFDGSLVGLIGERSVLTAPFRVWIDGEPVARPRSKAADPFLWDISTAPFATESAGAANLFAWTLLADDLKDGAHTLKIVPDFSSARPGADLRFESICSAGR